MRIKLGDDFHTTAAATATDLAYRQAQVHVRISLARSTTDVAIQRGVGLADIAAVGAFTKPRGLECQGQTLTGNVAAVRSQPVSGVTVAEEGFGGAAGNVRMT